MSKTMKKLVSFFALGLFIIALAINVHQTLTNPFSLESVDAIAQTSGDDDDDDNTGGTTSAHCTWHCHSTHMESVCVDCAGNEYKKSAKFEPHQ